MSSSPSRHLVDPELLPLLDIYPTFRLDAAALPELRRVEAENIPPVEEDSVTVEQREADGSNGAPSVPLRIYRPDAQVPRPLGCIYHVHGGGYVGGSARRRTSRWPPTACAAAP